MMLAPVFIATLFAAASEAALSTCARNYEKVGCYSEYNPEMKDLVVYDRYGIKWDQIVSYMHHLVCTCEAKVRELNKARSGAEKYAGFALQFWAECYGKTQSQIDALALKTTSSECTGNQSYTGCHPADKECAGHAFTDFVYQLKPAAGEERVLTYCDFGELSIACSEGLFVKIRHVTYGKRTDTTCGKPLSVGWTSKCENVSLITVSTMISFCEEKTTCVIKDWTANKLDPCPDVKKYITVVYKCEAK